MRAVLRRVSIELYSHVLRFEFSSFKVWVYQVAVETPLIRFAHPDVSISIKKHKNVLIRSK